MVVDKKTLRELLKILDPEGVKCQVKTSIKRKQYKTEGPNHVWH